MWCVLVWLRGCVHAVCGCMRVCMHAVRGCVLVWLRACVHAVGGCVLACMCVRVCVQEQA